MGSVKKATAIIKPVAKPRGTHAARPHAAAKRGVSKFFEEEAEEAEEDDEDPDEEA
jgi:hypothetical protein